MMGSGLYRSYGVEVEEYDIPIRGYNGFINIGLDKGLNGTISDWLSLGEGSYTTLGNIPVNTYDYINRKCHATVSVSSPKHFSIYYDRTYRNLRWALNLHGSIKTF
jgi:hypothetical protein